MKGLIVVVEGLERTGKTTLCKEFENVDSFISRITIESINIFVLEWNQGSIQLLHFFRTFLKMV